MKWAAKVFAVFLAAIVAFIGLAMTEEWQVFEPWIAGEAAPAVLPDRREVRDLMVQLAQSIENNRGFGRTNSVVSKVLEADRSFLYQYGVKQRLSLVALEITDLTASGPGLATANTRERSRLMIGKGPGALKRFLLEGTYAYTIRYGDGPMEITNFEHLEVTLIPVEATPEATPETAPAATPEATP